MEDQRNWSDASYKTYVRPLELPWPYRLADGKPLTQSVALTLDGDATAMPARDRSVEIEVAIGASIGPHAEDRPRRDAGGNAARSSRSLDRLAEVGPQTLTCCFDPTAGHGRKALAGFAELAKRTRAEITLECVVPCREDPAIELAAFAGLVRGAGLRLDAIAVSPSIDRQSTPPGSAWPACPPLPRCLCGCARRFSRRAAGRRQLQLLHRVEPKAAARRSSRLSSPTPPTQSFTRADDRSVMQTLEALPFITRSARAFIGEDKSYRIGPSTIAMRQNPYGSRTFDNPGGGSESRWRHADPAPQRSVRRRVDAGLRRGGWRRRNLASADAGRARQVRSAFSTRKGVGAGRCSTSSARSRRWPGGSARCFDILRSARCGSGRSRRDRGRRPHPLGSQI